MATEFWSLDGGVLAVEGAGASGWPAASSSREIRGGLGRAKLSSTGLGWLRTQLERYEGMRVTESYEHAGGPMRLLSGPLYGQRDFAYHGEQRALLWEAGGVGLALQAEGRSRRWFLDSAQTVRFEANGRSLRATPARPADWSFQRLSGDGSRLDVTIPGIGPASVTEVGTGRKPLRSDRSRRLRAGVLHSFDGEWDDRVFLDAETVRLQIVLLEASAEGAAERLAELDAVEWRQGR